jgi:CubicO group peptidase (beta-lactamase class C family)
MKPTLWLGFLLLAGGCLATYSQSVNRHSAEIEARIKQVEQSLTGWAQVKGKPNWTLEDRMQYYRVKGVSIAVIHNYQMEWAKGYGWADTLNRKPVTTTTLFQAASLSKSVHAMGVLRLVQEQRLDLNTDINRYLKRWKFPYDSVSHGKPITLGHLLSHTAGLSVHGFAGYGETAQRPSLLQVLDGVAPANSEAVRSVTEPGTSVQYSGGGITLSQLLVEDATGQPYDQYMQTQVLQPLGMNRSTFVQPPGNEFQTHLASGYRSDGKPMAGKYHVYPEQAAAGLWTTPTDMARLVLEMQLSLQGKSDKVLSPRMTRRMLTPYLHRYDAALGTFVFLREGGTTAYFQHSGLNEGFSCVYYGSVEGGNGVVILCNSDESGLIRELVNSVAAVYQWKDFYRPVLKKEVTLDPAITDAYTGTYGWSEEPEQSLRIYKQGTKLLYHPDKVPQAFEMHFEEMDTFFLHERPQHRYRFCKDKQGRVTYIQVQQGEEEWKLTKVK